MNLSDKLKENNAKRTHASVHYVAKSQRSGQKCVACIHFIKPENRGPACTVVKNPISPQGWCIRYRHEKTFADGGHVKMADGGSPDFVLPSDNAATQDFSLPSDAADQPSVAADVAKSGGIGLVKGGLGLVGLPGDLRALASSATDYLGNKVGASPETIQGIKDKAYDVGKYIPGPVGMMATSPTSSDLQKTVEGVTGKFYEPKTVAGQYAQTAGEFAPAMIGGPESLATKALTRVALPAAASETAGQLTQGTDAEPYARIAGALIGGGLPAIAAKATAQKIGATLPTQEELLASAKAGYNHPEVKGLEIKPEAVATKADDIIADLNQSGLRERNAPQVYAAIDELKNPIGFSPTTGGQVSRVDDINSVRRELNVTAGERNSIGRPTPEAMAAQKAVGHIDDFLTNIAPNDVVSGDAANAAQILKNANGDYSAAMHMADVDARLTRADRQAAKSGTGGNIDNAIRQKISAILDVSGRTRGYTPDEVAQMETVVRGTPSANLFRLLGKFGVSGGLSLLLHAGMAVPTGGASIPVAVAGTAARKIAEGITSRNANKISDMVAARSPLGQARTAALPLPAAAPPLYNKPLLNALLASSSLREQAMQPQTTQ